VYSQEVGRAAATKLCRSVITKGLESLLTESLLAARCYGVEKEVLDSLSNILPPADWQEVATYFISRSLRHGRRRSEEMAEAAATVEEAGVEPLMSRAASERQLRAGGHADALTEADLAAVIDHIRRSRAAATAGRGSQGTPL
jgi:3-hydroxyisobutyrate dehydrogenase-like beta-hydroxyacid dehydrogenase